MPYPQHSMIQEHNDKKENTERAELHTEDQGPMLTSDGPQTENGRENTKNSQTSDKTEIIIILS